MAAMDKAKEPQANASEKSTEMQVKNENANVSVENAIEALKEAQALLAAYRDADSHWQDPVQLLNTTAAALDEAALATRKDGGKEFLNARSADEQVKLMGELSQSVIKERQEILDATQKVVAGSRPAELWNPNTLIVYASHTGTSRDYALELQSHLPSADVVNIKDVSLLDLQERKRVYFICSTFGVGRPPRDAEAVYTTLQILAAVDEEQDGDLNNVLLAPPEKEALLGLEVAVAALGNSKFETFCKFGRELLNRLCALGAQEFLPLTLLDAKNGKDEQTRQFRGWEQHVLQVEDVSLLKQEAITQSDPQKDSSVESKCCVLL